MNTEQTKKLYTQLQESLPGMQGAFMVVLIKTKARLVAQATGKPLTAFDNIIARQFFFDYTEVTCYWKHNRDTIGKAVVDTNIRYVAMQHFIDKMRKDTAFKRSIGGTKWSIDLSDVIIDVKEHDALNWIGVYSNGHIEPEQALDRVIAQDTEYPIVDMKELIKKLMK
jgi:hypothetical protein